jgi:hypothetical protein
VGLQAVPYRPEIRPMIGCGRFLKEACDGLQISALVLNESDR